MARAWIDIVTPAGKRKKVLAALDSQSNATFISHTIGQPRAWDEGETSAVRGLGEDVHTEAAKAVIHTGHEKVELRGRFEPGGEFSDPDTHMLLSANDCRELRIDLNYAVDNLEHKPVRYRAPMKRARPTSISTPPRDKKYMEHIEDCTCRLSERMMSEYMAKTGGTSRQPKQVSPADVVIGKTFTPEQRRRVRTMVEKTYRGVFMKSPDEIPPALKGVKPVKWKLKEGAEPVRCRKPNWGPAQEAWLKDWTKRALKAGLITRAESSEWASRPVMVPK